MKFFLFYLSFIICSIYSAYGQQYSISGKVLNTRTKTPIDYATVTLADNEIWNTTDEKGNFEMKNVRAGKTTIVVYCFGYESKRYDIYLDRNILNLEIFLSEKTLALNDVVVTARGGQEIANSYLIDRLALDHLQMVSVADVSSLLPGGKTNSAVHLASSQPQRFYVNGSSGEEGNASFGVAIEVDGVRMSNNSGRDFNSSGLVDIGGPDVRNIASSNVESIEVITGIPSVEYGDMTNGMVKINSKKGKTPYIIDMATKPNIKHIAVSKGVDMNKNRGVLNVSYEYTNSISNLASPYTSYDRNGLSLNYSNVFNRGNQPILLNVGVSGNLGGYDSKSDPDLFVNTYTKQRDNVLRASISAKWLLKKRWITNIEVFGSVNYSDKLKEVSKKDDGTSSRVSIRTSENGYHVGQTYEENPNADILLIPPGHWYELSFLDSKPLSISTKIKGEWIHKLGIVDNKTMVGGEFSSSNNKGRGRYYADHIYTPTWREYRYDQEPALNNYAIYGEHRAVVPIDKSVQSRLELVAGLRSDITSINKSEYGTVNSISPRFNAKYVFWEGKKENLIKNFEMRLGWGKAVKLPPFAALYPLPSYQDILTFGATTTSEGIGYYAYYTMPRTRIYNENLKWQYNIQQSIGADINIKGIKVTVNASLDKTYNPYISTSIYQPFAYNFTSEESLNGSHIPMENRTYNVDKNTGIVTVTDKTGVQAPEILNHSVRKTFISNTKYVNGSPVIRRTFSWIVDFGKIPAIKTSLRWDGSYYYYKNIEKTIFQKTSLMAIADNESSEKYIGYYVGNSNSVANGDLSKSLNTNLTLTTHIPSLKMVVSLRLEASLYRYSRSLSEYEGKQLAFNIKDKNEYFASDDQQDIYASNSYTALYPLYYSTYDDVNTKIPFAEKFVWARDNDQDLFNELSKLVIRSNNTKTFNPDKISAYYSANISVTKEIGRFASISFNAINFLNSLQKVHQSGWDRDVSLFSSYIPPFYYGMSLRIKL